MVWYVCEEEVKRHTIVTGGHDGFLGQMFAALEYDRFMATFVGKLVLLLELTQMFKSKCHVLGTFVSWV
jgi:hypothetical protein